MTEYHVSPAEDAVGFDSVDEAISAARSGGYFASELRSYPRVDAVHFTETELRWDLDSGHSVVIDGSTGHVEPRYVPTREISDTRQNTLTADPVLLWQGLGKRVVWPRAEIASSMRSHRFLKLYRSPPDLYVHCEGLHPLHVVALRVFNERFMLYWAWEP